MTDPTADRLPSSPQKTWKLSTDADGQRFIVVRAAAFHALRKDLAGIFSEAAAANLLYRIGLSMGYSTPHAMQYQNSSEDDFWRLISEFLKDRGWGELTDHSTSPQNGKVMVNFSVSDSAFADGVDYSRPTCDVLRGALAARISLHYKRKLSSSSESTCKAKGSPKCDFIIELSQGNGTGV